MTDVVASEAKEMLDKQFDAAIDDLVELGKHWRRNRDRNILSYNIRRAILGTCTDLLSIDAEQTAPSSADETRS